LRATIRLVMTCAKYIKDLILRARALPSLYFFNTASVDHFLNSTKRTWSPAIHS